MDEDEEIIVKAMSDYWVVGKKSDQRELYVILNQKNANLIEVNGKWALIFSRILTIGTEMLSFLYSKNHCDGEEGLRQGLS